jgi:glycosyltransferase involved in cell wall biosynthesis
VGPPFGPGGAERLQVLFCPGGTRAKKGLDAAIAGAARLESRPTIVVTGPATGELERCTQRARAAGVKLVHLEQLEEAELVEHYRSALAVALLSRSEGFGLPVLEALACGTPVIVPRQSAQAEVAGAAGLRVEPLDADSVAGAIGRAREEREQLRADGLDRAAQFSWERTATAIEELWAEILR